MIYGQFQYFDEELSGWTRIIVSHKETLGESVRQLAMLVNYNLITGSAEVECGAFTDQLMVQEQQFDFLSGLIVDQKHRLHRALHTPDAPIENHVCEQQESIRSKMKTAERNFIRSKYNCSFFIASFFGERALSATY